MELSDDGYVVRQSSGRVKSHKYSELDIGGCETCIPYERQGDLYLATHRKHFFILKENNLSLEKIVLLLCQALKNHDLKSFRAQDWILS